MTKKQYQFDARRRREEAPAGQMPTRAEIQRKKKDDRQERVKLINILLAVFTLIPIIILLYVLSDFYSPSLPNKVPVEKNEVKVGMTEEQPLSTHFWFPAYY